MAKIKERTARAVHANRGVEAAYHKRLLLLVDEMQRSAAYWVKAGYKAHEPLAMATDASPSAEMQKRLDRLSRRWFKRFDELSDKIAKLFVEAGRKATDSAFAAALRDAGMTVKFQMSRPMQDAMTASIEENVGLIKSIPERYFSQVQGAVMRGYSMGRDLQAITDDLEQISGVSRRRCAFIARDQSNKLNSVVVDARRDELGITEAIWQHSHGGKEPRLDHVAAHGKKYDLDKGCYISGEWIKPGYLINCRCTSRSVLPF